MNKVKNDLFHYMQANDDSDLPQGAWQAMLEDAVEAYNNQHGTNFDPYDMFMEYIQWKM